MNEQLIKFIELCLMDGVVTDKEREVIFRKSKEFGVPDDECEIILEGMIYQKRVGVPVFEKSEANDKTLLNQTKEVKQKLDLKFNNLNNKKVLLNEVKELSEKIKNINERKLVLTEKNHKLKEALREESKKYEKFIPEDYYDSSIKYYESLNKISIRGGCILEQLIEIFSIQKTHFKDLHPKIEDIYFIIQLTHYFRYNTCFVVFKKMENDEVLRYLTRQSLGPSIETETVGGLPWFELPEKELYIEFYKHLLSRDKGLDDWKFRKKYSTRHDIISRAVDPISPLQLDEEALNEEIGEEIVRIGSSNENKNNVKRDIENKKIVLMELELINLLSIPTYLK